MATKKDITAKSSARTSPPRQATTRKPAAKPAVRRATPARATGAVLSELKSLARELVGNQARERNLLTKWVDLGRWERHAASASKEAVIQDTCFGALMLEVYYRYLPLGK